MKAVILAGGLGSRLSEETQLVPKPMVRIGEAPMLWHIMKFYASYGIRDFVICLGYKGHVIQEYFYNYRFRSSDVTINTRTQEIIFHKNDSDDWNVTLVHTGDKSMTGGRLKRIKPHVDDTFCMTYGDGLSDVDLTELIEFHHTHGKLATVTAVSPPGRFGQLKVEEDRTVSTIIEKPDTGDSVINGGFFVLEPCVLDFIDGDGTIWERAPMEYLAQKGDLKAYLHGGFWHPMDTLRDKEYLESLWISGTAPWAVWKNAEKKPADVIVLGKKKYSIKTSH